LGAEFKGERGDHFFRSTLVQTLFYGIFSAWVLWAREPMPSPPIFDWRLSGWYLKVPMLRTLFQQLADPGRLQPLGLVEVLDWAAQTLNRVDRAEFFARFKDAEAVQYFYEPFLEAFDPELRAELGVWYTPVEVVSYMVARVDRALRDDLGISDGLAAENVYVLDPCCGTGATSRPFCGASTRRSPGAGSARSRLRWCARPRWNGCSGSRSWRPRSSSRTSRSDCCSNRSARRSPTMGPSAPRST
jgi:hypothetical protein